MSNIGMSNGFEAFVTDQYERFEHLGEDECLEVLKIVYESLTDRCLNLSNTWFLS